ncbi:MAG: hypothetical protein KC431_28625 [Myxococcales bacterium]|nr:hypothetical protein [Myxococcales bacterium]
MLLLASAATSAACHRSSSKPPTHDELINAHLEGHYQEVLRWCPVMFDDPGSDARLAEWCLYGLPAAMRLTMDTKSAHDFVRTVCVDEPTGRVQGSQEFREYYVREASRWVALALRAQGRVETLGGALDSTMNDFSEACEVDAAVVAEGIDTKITSKAGRR